MTTETTPQDNGIRPMISIKEVLKLVPVSRSTLHRMVREKTFPQSHELSPMRVGFFLDEVVEWQRKLAEKAA
ncbi:helix-turn-helix transcriptional regulator [Bradyrhizobium denitrificans]